ncbi:MAG: UDP-N-acetylmuramoyl-L-alanyl-D-glutamate--2,6-diaminopimelate ligase [Clostridiales bacterium]|nr:UDP-N-acetylmuramoyl-L-alanyl-D-glutamate--2,6-diaminopimelate ligase [Clostridiales bacterium]
MQLTKLLADVIYKNPDNHNLEDIDIAYVVYDSRKATFDTVFVCITGAVHDGHDFAQSAYNKGCRVFVCEHEVDLPEDAIILLVSNARIALARLSATLFGYPAEKLSIIGITGTKGKTTTAHLIAQILTKAGYRAAYIGSNGISFGNAHYPTTNTTPESYDLHYYFNKMVNAKVQYVVMEVSSQALYHFRVYGIKFSICVFTNLSPDHIGGIEHPTFSHYKNCKISLFRDYGCECIVYNADDPHHRDMIKNTGVVTRSFALRENADFSASDINLLKENGHLGVSFVMHTVTENLRVELYLPGEFNIYNALAAVAVCRHLGIGYSTMLSTLKSASIRGRLEVIPALLYCTFIIDYAHNEVSLRSVLTALRQYNPTRLICLFGSVGGRTKMRRAKLGKVASELADFSILTSDNPDFEAPENIINDIARAFPENSNAYIKIPDRAEAIKYAVENAAPGDIVLLAGKGHEEYQLIEGKKIRMNEKELLIKYAMEFSEEIGAIIP